MDGRLSSTIWDGLQQYYNTGANGEGFRLVVPRFLKIIKVRERITAPDFSKTEISDTKFNTMTESKNEGLNKT